MTTTDATTFTLSQEEVYFLLQQVRATGLLGIDSAPLAGFDADQRQAVLTAAGRALQARGIIGMGEDGQPLLDAAVRATIHAAAFATSSLTAIARGPGESLLETYIVHHAEPLWVEHTQPAPGLYEFTLAPAPPTILGRLEHLLHVEAQAAPPASTFAIDQAELEAIQAAASSEPQVLFEAVVAAGADEPTARLFTDLLTEPRDSAIAQAINRQGDVEETRTITLLRNQYGFWLLEADGPSQLSCSPASAADVRRVLNGLIEQL